MAVEDAVGATRQTGVAMRPMAAFSNGGDHLLLNKQWRAAVANSDETLIAMNAKLRAELTAQRTKQVTVQPAAAAAWGASAAVSLRIWEPPFHCLRCVPQYVAHVLDRDSEVAPDGVQSPRSAVEAAKEAVRRSRRNRLWVGKDVGDFDRECPLLCLVTGITP